VCGFCCCSGCTLLQPYTLAAPSLLVCVCLCVFMWVCACVRARVCVCFCVYASGMGGVAWRHIIARATWMGLSVRAP